jgi:RimJ/RimL family protein N-acetyltransferase
MQIKYIFFSKRLGFRNWEEKDIQLYQYLSADPEVMKYFPREFWLDADSARKSVIGFKEHFQNNGYTYFAVDLLDTNDFIGFIGMKKIAYEVFFAPAIDIGWRLSKKYWGRGYATEGAKKCLEWFFENFQADRIVSMTPTLNLASENVMRKIGMAKICDFDHPLLKKEDPLLNHVLYEIKRPI